MKWKVTIVGLIYKSVPYLEFMVKNWKKTCISGEGLEVDFLVVANDASDDVLSMLPLMDVSWIQYHDPKPNDYWLNRVYRAWNIGGFAASGEVIVFWNSDMCGHANWLENLLAELSEDTIPCSRLIESGKMPSGKHGISMNFGRTLKEFHREGFDDYCRSIIYDGSDVEDGGLFMPVAFRKEDFVASGGYPEGNLYSGGFGAHTTSFIESGDSWFFTKNPVMSKKRHVTVMDSLVYHFQNGEKDE